MKSFQEFASLLEDNSYLEKGKKASIVQGAVSGNPKALWLLSKQRIAENDIYSGEYSTGRYYLPEEVAEVACFLVSDASSCLSGQIIICNNGDSINYRK